MSISKDDIAHNLNQLKERIRLACQDCGRDPESVQLLLATKTQPVKTIAAALELGVTLIGENRVQEALQKWPALQNYTYDFHFIGQLQSNKIKDVLKFATCVQSLDRLSLAEKLNDMLRKKQRILEVLIQVNTSFEESKAGLAPEHAIEFIKKASQFKQLKIKGLMTIGIFSDDADKVRDCFKRLKAVQQKALALTLPNADLTTLSMGMSADLETAIAEGSTMLRIGSALFGHRL